MKLVLTRAMADCGIAAMATLLEQTYEDVYVVAAKIDKRRRGRSGIFVPGLIRVARSFGMHLALKRTPVNLDDDGGLLIVQWKRGSGHMAGTRHAVVLGNGVIVDPCDGLILPADEYLARERATVKALLVEV